MKPTTRLILVLAIFSLLLSACGGQPSTGSPNADHLVKFNKDGIAALQGRLAGGSWEPNRETLRFLIPVKVEGMETGLEISFTVRPETELSSSLTPQTDALDYNSFHSNSGIYRAFPAGALTEITFRKNGVEFEAVSLHEVTRKPLFQKKATIDHVFSTDVFSQGTVSGSFTQVFNNNDGTMVWRLSIPMDVQGIQADLILPIQSTPNTQVITSQGPIPVSSQFSWGNVQILFTRKGDALIADKITVNP